MKNFKLVLEYDGTNYVGWQRQRNGTSVQGEIELALEKLLQDQVTLNGAGRTDAGVHARGQVANFQTSVIRTSDQILAALNSSLPPDIVVKHVTEVPVDFHARFDATERRYSYTITIEPTAMLRHSCWWIHYQLDIPSLQKAAQIVLGTHDFTSFCKTQSDVEHHRCNVTISEWQNEGSNLIYRIGANRFLHGMVRTLVGTMVDIGRGYSSLEDFESILERRDRRVAGKTAPPQGLVLEEVLYFPNN